MNALKTIFDKNSRNELIRRIETLTENHTAEWGKMSIHQMLNHNTYWNGWILGTGHPTYRHAFLGKIFGKIALKKMIRDDTPFDRNIPTSAQFKFSQVQGNVETEKTKWISQLKEYRDYSNPEFIHDFFGRMTREEIGIMVYKHTDHHLRQFNA